ncbi:hypothetical protein EJB05_27484, partial [Eragrostis curvula]
MAAANADARDGQTALALRLVKHLAPPEGAAASENVAFSPGVPSRGAGAGGRGLARRHAGAAALAFLGSPSAQDLADLGRRVAHRVLADRSDSGGPRVLFGGGLRVDASRGGLTDAFRDVAAESESYKSEVQTVTLVKKIRCQFFVWYFISI